MCLDEDYQMVIKCQETSMIETNHLIIVQNYNEWGLFNSHFLVKD
jgi:hypothetical protein